MNKKFFVRLQKPKSATFFADYMSFLSKKCYVHAKTLEFIALIIGVLQATIVKA